MPRNIPGLTPAEDDAYRAAMKAPGARTWRRATVLDLDHNPLRTLTDELTGGILGGQVHWTPKSDVHTTATVVFSDFDDQIDLDLRHLLRVDLGVTAADGAVLWAPLSTGWVRQCDDNGHEAQVVTHDVTAIGMEESERGRASRGERVGEVIWRMHHRMGFRHFNIPDSLREGGPKLAGPVEWGGGKPEKSVTRMSRRIAKRAGLQVFADQLARITVREEPGEPAVSWVEPSALDVEADVDARLLEPITWARDYKGLRNRVVGGGRRTLRAVATTKDGYRFSPEKLTMGGVPLHLTHRFEDDTIDSEPELREATEAMLRRMSVDRAEIRIASTPAPWAIGQDRLHAAKRDGRATDFWMNEGGIELDGSAMTIGYILPMRPRPGTRVRSSGRGYTPKELRERRQAQRRREARRG